VTDNISHTYDVRRSFVQPRPPLSDERRQRLECSDVDAADEVTKFTLGVDIPCTHVALRLVSDEVPCCTHLTTNQLTAILTLHTHKQVAVWRQHGTKTDTCLIDENS